jgi:hypothetical protein
MEIVPVEVAHSFYEECLFAKSEEKAIEALKDSCDKILSNIHLAKDERTKHIISDAVIWAKNNPSELTTYHTRKIDRWTNLPHVASFLPLMSMLSAYSKLHKSRIIKITHDEQDQVKKVLNEIHEIAADPARLTTVDLRDNGIIELSHIKNTTFEIKDSSNSFGLQTVDICLYIFTHDHVIEEKKTDWPNTYKLLDYIKAHTEFYELTTRRHHLETNYHYNKIMNMPLTENDLKRGKKTVEKWENQFKENLNRQD